MKYVKMLGLLAIAAAALMAFAGTASATLTEAAGDPVDVGDTVTSSAGATSLTGTISITCQKSSVSGTTTSNGTKASTGTVESLSFSECGNHTVTPVPDANGHFGTLEINNKGQVFSTGAVVTVLLHSLFLGTVHCIYTTNATDIGDLTGGTQATLDIVSKAIPRTATDGACGEHSTWEGTYTVTTPHELLVH